MQSHSEAIPGESSGLPDTRRATGVGITQSGGHMWYFDVACTFQSQ